jgi:phage terminase small subunit
LSTDANGLNPKQLAFCLEWLKDRNATQAAIRAGYSVATAKQTGTKILTYASVKKYLATKTAEFVAKAEAESGTTVARVLKEVERIAYLDVEQMFDENGALLPISQIPEDLRRAIAGFEVIETFEWEGEGPNRRRVFSGYLKKVKLVSKDSMLTLSARHLGMLHDTVTIKEDDRVAKLQEAISRAGGVK